jgi:hypothetical protein
MLREFSRCTAEAAKSTRQNHALRCTRGILSRPRECIKCHSQQARERYKRNPEPAKRRSREQRTRNPEAISEYHRKYSEEHAEELAAKARKRYEKTKEQIKARSREAYWHNPKPKKAYAREAYYRDPEPRKAYVSKYKKENRKLVSAKEKERKRTNPKARLMCNLRTSLSELMS